MNCTLLPPLVFFYLGKFPRDFIFHDPDTFEECRPAVLQNVPNVDLSDYSLMVRFRINLFFLFEQTCHLHDMVGGFPLQRLHLRSPEP